MSSDSWELAAGAAALAAEAMRRRKRTKDSGGEENAMALEVVEREKQVRGGCDFSCGLGNWRRFLNIYLF